ncbi:LAME_0A07734g1_1 [Lachancea meyersii CBS 8951]|uniref:LAME_0A07734g1_1 n=1 Tax=Lachancea meyersii CBS 8951 TaxID=1266667 RepID=A0A1G4IR28_9SACH|nr:LAME_0A07734g1_1 [Lachancea meyersii CBS 8951]
MGRYSVKRYKTKRRTKDLDVIFNDLTSPAKIQQLLNQPLDETKPGLGQHYCIHCDKYFETAFALKTHLKGKVHRRRVKELKGVPYTQEVSDAASGLNLQKFLNTVEQINQQTGPIKEANETELKAHLDTTLANVATTEPTLPHLVEEQAQPDVSSNAGEVQME